MTPTDLALIERIIELAKQSDASDLRLVNILAKRLSREEITLLFSKLNTEGLQPQAIENINDAYFQRMPSYIFREEALAKEMRRNAPVSQLFEWFCDKKSGMVREARRQLQERFMHLSYEEQLKTIRLFLASGKTDRLWCYNTLRRWWTDDLLDDIRTVWNEYHEERCSWLVTEKFTEEEIQADLDHLMFPSNHYPLCRRFAEKPWLTIDKDIIREKGIANYLWIMSRTKEGLLREETLMLIYEHLLLVQQDLHPYSNEHKRVILPQNRFYTYQITESTIKHSLCFWELAEMENILASLCRMNQSDIARELIERDTQWQEEFLLAHEFEVQSILQAEVSDAYYMLRPLVLEYLCFCIDNIYDLYIKPFMPQQSSPAEEEPKEPPLSDKDTPTAEVFNPEDECPF